MKERKFQIFISSTYLDLQEERQAAVEAILGSKHIPAGMELFKAGNKSQLETIKKWIDESDLYMLILGGRYGSIESESGKSYTQLEYEYAIEKNIPVFAVVLKDSFLHRKAAESKNDIFENENVNKYKEFKEFVMSKVIVEVEDCKDIKIAIKDSIEELKNENKLVGWIRNNEDDNNQLSKELIEIKKKNIELKKQYYELRNRLDTQKSNYLDLHSVNIFNLEDEYIKIRYRRGVYDKQCVAKFTVYDTIYYIGMIIYKVGCISHNQIIDKIKEQISLKFKIDMYNLMVTEDDFLTLEIQLESLNILEKEIVNNIFSFTKYGEELFRNIILVKNR